MSFHFKLVTPDRTLLDERVESVTLPTAEGEITVLTHHAPLAALLVPGVMKINGNRSDEIAVSGGFIEVVKDGVVALAATAERGAELDMSTIEQAKSRAQAVMRKAAAQDDVSFAAAAAALERELARFKVARRHKKV